MNFFLIRHNLRVWNRSSNVDESDSLLLVRKLLCRNYIYVIYLYYTFVQSNLNPTIHIVLIFFFEDFLNGFAQSWHLDSHDSIAFANTCMSLQEESLIRILFGVRGWFLHLVPFLVHILIAPSLSLVIIASIFPHHYDG